MVHGARRVTYRGPGSRFCMARYRYAGLADRGSCFYPDNRKTSGVESGVSGRDCLSLGIHFDRTDEVSGSKAWQKRLRRLSVAGFARGTWMNTTSVGSLRILMIGRDGQVGT